MSDNNLNSVYHLSKNAYVVHKLELTTHVI